MVVIAITVAVSVAVYWRARAGKFKALSFHLQRNQAYRVRGAGGIQNLAIIPFKGGTVSGIYSYPMVDMEVDATEPNDDPIVMERNKAYGTKNTTGTNEVPNNTQASTLVSTDRTEATDTCATETLHVQAERSNVYATPTITVITEEGNQASIEYCYITSEEYQQHAATAVSKYNAYESISTTLNNSGNTKYDYILD